MNCSFVGMKIIFLGTPEFSVASLDAIVKAGYDVVAVVTSPDKAAGRGMQIQSSAVKKYALEKNIPVLQPTRLRDPDFLTQLKSYNADLQIVIAFRMLPESVWNMPRLGTINLHASLLPDYRGAAPINHAIINGEKESGVCTFFLKHEIDTGDILDKKSYSISESMNAGELHDALMNLGAELIVESLNKIKNGNYTCIPQVQRSSKIAPKIFKPFCEINWNKSMQEVYNHIRGLSPYPAAYTQVEGKNIKVFLSQKVALLPLAEPGTIQSDNKSFLRFACQDGWIEILNLQEEGKKRMNIEEYLRGKKVNV